MPIIPEEEGEKEEEEVLNNVGAEIQQEEAPMLEIKEEYKQELQEEDSKVEVK